MKRAVNILLALLTVALLMCSLLIYTGPAYQPDVVHTTVDQLNQGGGFVFE